MSEDDVQPYARFSDVELLELAASGASSFRPDAWRALENELRKRGPSLDTSAPALPTHSAPDSSGILKPEAIEPEVKASTGIGGWLAFFVGMMFLSAIVAVVTVEAFRSLSWIAPLSALHEIAVIVGLVLTFRRDRVTPTFWKGLLVLTAVFSALLAATDVTTWSSAAFSAAWSLTWAGYWANSRRVRVTFHSRSTRKGRARTDSDAPMVADIDPAAR
jgi:hypothetical protein